MCHGAFPNLGWFIPQPFDVGDLVEFSKEFREKNDAPDGVFRISRIDLDPANWITSLPVTIWLESTGALNHPWARPGGEIVVSCDRYAKWVTYDFKQSYPMFKKTGTSNETP
jgi:hypothetical protein